METLILLIGMLLSMAGCHRLDGHMVSVHTRENGVDRLYSDVLVSESLVVFHCIAARGGSCHYRLFDPGCSSGSGSGCAARPLRSFRVPAGQRWFDTTLPAGVVPCVSESEDGFFEASCRNSRTS